jgi:hypothetical protein
LPVTAFTHLTPAQFGAARLQGARALRLLEQSYAVNAYYSAFRQSNAPHPNSSKTRTLAARGRGPTRATRRQTSRRGSRHSDEPGSGGARARLDGGNGQCSFRGVIRPPLLRAATLV